jgi:holo-[acyl-carrier protein] synthase
MTQHIGVDIVEINRIEKAITRWGDAFLKRVFTQEEIERYGRKIQSLAARFAAKEAVSKALGKPAGISWQHIEVLSDNNGQPSINLYGKARERADNLGLDSLAVSLAHSREYAIAFVSGQSKK